MGPQAVKLFAPLQAALQPNGAGAFQRQDALSTGDLSGLERAGVPSFAPLPDTFDKVDPDNLRRHVALMSATACFLANVEQPIGRATVPAP